VLGDDGIVGVEEAGLGEEVVGLVVLAEGAGLGGGLRMSARAST
jgi:hypothetical protein